MGYVLPKLSSISSRIRWHLKPSCKPERSKREDARRNYLLHLALLEQGERDDHRAALALERGASLPPPTNAQIEMSKVSFLELLEKYMVVDLQVAERRHTEVVPVESKRTIASLKKRFSVECVVCCDLFDSDACLHGPCGHYICRQCVVAMAEVANRNEDIFPLQCCQQQLPVDTFLSFLHGPLLATFSSKCAEAATPHHLRVYCPNKRCAIFAGRSRPSMPHGMTCVGCNTSICLECKNCAHPGETCDDLEDGIVRDLAQKNDWKRCPRCRMIVERSDGCDYMWCRCRQDFCYQCGVKWRSCVCNRASGGH